VANRATAEQGDLFADKGGFFFEDDAGQGRGHESGIVREVEVTPKEAMGVCRV
jgi:hypothetical protein